MKQKCHHLIIKLLADNDDNRHGIYLGGHEAIQILPATNVQAKPLSSKKTKKADYIFHHNLNYYWLTESELKVAPSTKLIYYAQYPEVRLSGFLQNCKLKNKHLLSNNPNTVFPKRVLFLGKNNDGQSFGYISLITSKLKSEIEQNASPLKSVTEDVTFYELYINHKKVTDSKAQLLKELKNVVNLGWIPSCKLTKDKKSQPYKARNGGGFTLEAQLGIAPNSNRDPDYLGWEIKQSNIKQGPISLFTPEPDGGAYRSNFEKFMKTYGYKDATNPNRINFGGIYKTTSGYHPKTKLKLIMHGFKNGKFTDTNGYLALVTENGKFAASWSFQKLLESWTTKHINTVFIKSEKRATKNHQLEYKYLKTIYFGSGTTIDRFLTAMEKGLVYIDPSHKIIYKNSKVISKKQRTQFRVHKSNLSQLYENFEEFQL